MTTATVKQEQTIHDTIRDTMHANGYSLINTGGNAAFMNIMTGPNPLTREQVDKLISRNPRWSRFAAFGTTQKAPHKLP